MENMTEFQKNIIRMWDSLRDKYKDEPRCISVDCEVCPLHECCYGDDGNISFNSEKAIEIVTQWAKEHPIITRADKYREVFGVEPKCDNNYACPRRVGFIATECGEGHACEKCKDEFWNSEYKEPKKEGDA